MSEQKLPYIEKIIVQDYLFSSGDLLNLQNIFNFLAIFKLLCLFLNFKAHSLVKENIRCREDD